MSMIELENVKMRYKNGVNALCGVNLTIEQGEFVIARTRQEAKRGYADKYKKK